MIISEMQSKLAAWSTENKERKFDRLLRLVADRTWLGEAARITLASSGAKTPGVDGIDKVQMEEISMLNSRRSVSSCWRTGQLMTFKGVGLTTRCQRDVY